MNTDKKNAKSIALSRVDSVYIEHERERSWKAALAWRLGRLLPQCEAFLGGYGAIHEECFRVNSEIP